MSWKTGWTNRKSHVILGSSGAGEGYQVKIIVNYAGDSGTGNTVGCNSNCRQDFGDIRFTGSDGVTELPYWMETKTDGANAVFWVKVLGNLDANQTIYVYYNKSDEATTSNGTNTFLAFRDLVSDFYAALGTISLTTYANGSDPGDYFIASQQVDSTYLSPSIFFRVYGGEKYSVSSTPKLHFEAYLDSGNNGFTGTSIRVRTSAAPTGWQTSQLYAPNSTLNKKHIIVLDYQKLTSAGGLVFYSTWSITDDMPYGASAAGYALDSSTRTVAEYVYPGSIAHISVYAYTGQSIDVYRQNYAVAKYVSPEPSDGDWGEEESPSAVLPFVHFGKGNETHALRVVTEGNGNPNIYNKPKIRKDGTTYELYLVETTDPTASPVRIKTTTQGVKAFQCAEACQVCQACNISCQTCYTTCETCDTPCDTACQTACESACQDCQTTCETSCQTGCEVSCQVCNVCVICQTGNTCPPMYYTCQECETCQPCYSCVTTCQTGCEVSCQATCQLSCQDCQTTCETICNNCQQCNTCQTRETCPIMYYTCETCQQCYPCYSCQSACESACQTACDTVCQDCQTTCETICNNCQQCVICETGNTCPPVYYTCQQCEFCYGVYT